MSKVLLESLVVISVGLNFLMAAWCVHLHYRLSVTLEGFEELRDWVHRLFSGGDRDID